MNKDTHSISPMPSKSLIQSLSSDETTQQISKKPKTLLNHSNKLPFPNGLWEHVLSNRYVNLNKVYNAMEGMTSGAELIHQLSQPHLQDKSPQAHRIMWMAVPEIQSIGSMTFPYLNSHEELSHVYTYAPQLLHGVDWYYSMTFSHVPRLCVSEYIGRVRGGGLFLTLPLVYFLSSACSALIPLFSRLLECLPECLPQPRSPSVSSSSSTICPSSPTALSSSPSIQSTSDLWSSCSSVTGPSRHIYAL